MNNLHPSFTEILQNAIKAIEPKQTPTPTPTTTETILPMVTVHFFPNEFKAAEMAIYSVLARLQVEAEEQQAKADNADPATPLRGHYNSVARRYREDVANIRMAANAMYHATKRESRPR